MHVHKKDTNLIFYGERYSGCWFAHSSNERDAQFTTFDDTIPRGSTNFYLFHNVDSVPRRDAQMG
jgi:hypothetical protein